MGLGCEVASSPKGLTLGRSQDTHRGRLSSAYRDTGRALRVAVSREQKEGRDEKRQGRVQPTA